MVAQADGRTDGDKEEGTDRRREGRLDTHIMAKGVVLNWI